MCATTPPSPPPPRDPDELRIKKFEELYALAKSALAADNERLADAEVKASRYFSVLALVLGLNAAGFQDFLATIRETSSASSVIFVLSYTAGSVCNGLAVWHLFRALAVTKIFALPVDKSLLDHFWSHRYEDAIYGMTKEYLDSTQGMRKHVDEKLGWVRLGFRWLSCALIAAVICVASFTVMKSEENKMTDNEAQNQPAPAPAPAPAPEASPAPAPSGGDSTGGTSEPASAGPNPAVSGPKFVQLDRGAHQDSTTHTKVPKPGE